MPVFASGDAIEGATAFAEKRPPVWKSTLTRQRRQRPAGRCRRLVASELDSWNLGSDHS